jgi:hypothetical protein
LFVIITHVFFRLLRVCESDETLSDLFEGDACVSTSARDRINPRRGAMSELLVPARGDRDQQKMRVYSWPLIGVCRVDYVRRFVCFQHICLKFRVPFRNENELHLYMTLNNLAQKPKLSLDRESPGRFC